MVATVSYLRTCSRRFLTWQLFQTAPPASGRTSSTSISASPPVQPSLYPLAHSPHIPTSHTPSQTPYTSPQHPPSSRPQTSLPETHPPVSSAKIPDSQPYASPSTSQA